MANAYIGITSIVWNDFMTLYTLSMVEGFEFYNHLTTSSQQAIMFAEFVLNHMRSIWGDEGWDLYV